MKIKIILFTLTILLAASGCTAQPISTDMPTNTTTPIVNTIPTITSTMIAGTDTFTIEPAPTATAEPMTLTPTSTLEIVPVDGICTINSNVRSYPGRGGDNLGGIIFGNRIQVLARNPASTWYLINYQSSPSGTGWVRSTAVKVKGYLDLLPIALENDSHQFNIISPSRWTIFGTPLPLPTLSSATTGKSAKVNQTADVRVCPNTSCMIIAYLQTGDQIIMVGREGQNEWAQFQYPSGPNGIGWVSSMFFVPQPEAWGSLPYFDELGNLITPEPPTSTPDPRISPTPTLTATATPAGPLAEITGTSIVYSQQSSLSTILGTLQPGTKVNITRESLNKIWFEIQYPANTTSRAYISTKYIRLLGDFRYLNYTDANGTPVPTP